MINVRRARGWLVLSALALGQLACTSMRPVESSGGAPAEAVQAGDRISIVDTSGVTTELVVTTIGINFIEGMTAGDTPTRLATADVTEIRVERNAPGKTAGLAAGLTLLLFVQGFSAAGTMGLMQ